VQLVLLIVWRMPTIASRKEKEKEKEQEQEQGWVQVSDTGKEEEQGVLKG